LTTSYSSWYTGVGEPNGGTSENCATLNHGGMYCTILLPPPTIFSKKKYINIFSHADGLWRSLPCSNTYAVMCEKVVETSPKGINFDMFGARKNVVNSCF